jgi:glyoxylase-like metal-dependent hydrolase (beta-lactamase superfamily II)
MIKRNFFLAFSLIFTSITVVAQDAQSVLQKAARAMGADEMVTIQYSGTGWVGAVGQNFTPDLDWPRLELSSYTRTIDFDSMSSKEEMVIEQGDYPTRGGGGIPIQGERRRTYYVSDGNAWEVRGDDDLRPTPANAEMRMLEIYLTPYGFIKGAMAGNPTAVTRHEYGERVTVVSFIALDKYRINATFSEEGLMHRIQTWLPNPVVGDMYYETVYSNYREIGGIQFPGRWHQHKDFDDGANLPNVSGGDHAFGLEDITDVTVNVRGARLDVPDNVRNAETPEVRVESSRLADGVWLIGGGSHNSVAIEFEDYITVVEAPRNEARSLAVIDEVYRLMPGKPIRFIVNTHHHWDHVGGIRTYVHEGATIITHANNRTYYQEVLRAGPWLLEPDRYSLFPLEEWSEGYIFETVFEKYVLADDSRRVEMHNVLGLSHVEGMLIVYLPEEKMVIEADLYTPRPLEGAPPPSASNRTFYENIQRLGLDIETIVPIHGRPGPMSQFVQYIDESE